MQTGLFVVSAELQELRIQIAELKAQQQNIIQAQENKNDADTAKGNIIHEHIPNIFERILACNLMSMHSAVV